MAAQSVGLAQSEEVQRRAGGEWEVEGKEAREREREKKRNLTPGSRCTISIFS